MKVIESHPESTIIATIKILGENITELPRDLYIPPEALRIFLETFEGPLDLLLYLIKKQNLNILDIPVAEISRQYMQYIEVVQELQLALASDYLVMAAMLVEIKSRLLLPRPVCVEGNEEADPRAELVRRLQEYERFKEAAMKLDEIARVERDIFLVNVDAPLFSEQQREPEVKLEDLLQSLYTVMERAKLYSHHPVQFESLSIRERMTQVLERANGKDHCEFHQLFSVEEGQIGVVVTLIAILELIRQSLLELIQSQPFAIIYVKVKN